MSDATGTLSLLVFFMLYWSLFSVLIKDNVLFKFAEKTYIVAYVVSGLFTTSNLVVGKAIGEAGIGPQNLALFVMAAIFGLLVLTRFSGRTAWIARYPMALFLGALLGVSIPTIVISRITSQIASTVSLPIATLDIASNISNIILIVVMAAVIIYFTFTIPQKTAAGAWYYVSRIGRVALLVYFGYSATQQMVSALTGIRVTLEQFLLNFLHIPAF